MTEKAFVISIKDQEITVMPMEKDDCATCGAECSKKAHIFTAGNPRQLPVKIGSIVKLQYQKKIQALQGVISLVLPILFAVAGFFLATPIMAIFGKTAGEGSKALFVLLFFALSSLLIFITSRKNPLAGNPEIVEIL